jgi:hypothetical protein
MENAICLDGSANGADKMKIYWFAVLMMLVAGINGSLIWTYGAALQPAPSVNSSSNVLCGFVADSGQTITTTVFNYTGETLATYSNASMPPNNTYVIAPYNFSNVNAGDYVGVRCSVGGVASQSQLYRVSSSASFGDTSNDNLALGSLLGFSLFAFIFAYLHLHAESKVWSMLWRQLCFFMILMVFLSILYFSQLQNAPGITNIALALVIGFSGVFVLSMWFFILETIKDIFTAITDAVNGRKNKNDKGGR